MFVRRLTPTECERLQGFPDGWTLEDSEGKTIADSPRYRMLGNAVTVNVAHWIGIRLAAWFAAHGVRAEGSNPWWTRPTTWRHSKRAVDLYCGDVRETLRQLPEASVQCVCTSPPYWGLRDYGIAPQVWGGLSDPACRTAGHVWEPTRWYTEALAGGVDGEAFSEPGPDNAERLKRARWREAANCSPCGAWQGALGLEPTPDLYVAHLVEVFREVLARAPGGRHPVAQYGRFLCTVNSAS